MPRFRLGRSTGILLTSFGLRSLVHSISSLISRNHDPARHTSESSRASPQPHRHVGTEFRASRRTGRLVASDSYWRAAGGPFLLSDDHVFGDTCMERTMGGL